MITHISLLCANALAGSISLCPSRENDTEDTHDAEKGHINPFQPVQSLTFFIEDNAGGDVTEIGGLKIMAEQSRRLI